MVLGFHKFCNFAGYSKNNLIDNDTINDRIWQGVQGV